MTPKWTLLLLLMMITSTGIVYYWNGFYFGTIFTANEQKSGSIPVIVGAYNSDPPLTSCESSDSFPDIEYPSWHKVAHDTEWYVYSAYVDDRPQNVVQNHGSVVRILAMSKGGSSSSAALFCRLWWQHESGNESTAVRALKEELWIRRWDSAPLDRYYHPYLLSCHLPTSERHPSSVSVVSGEPCDGQAVTHRLGLFSEQRSTNVTRDFVVCLKPLDTDEDISSRLVEWLELQFLLGAERVHAYVYRLPTLSRQVLRHYVQLGKVVAVNYTLPGDSKYTVSDLWQKRRHEMAVYNDCFYKHSRSHRFVVNLDLDEAIVPVGVRTWSELLLNLPTAASLSVRNVYFFDAFGSVSDNSIPYFNYTHMLRHVIRSANFTPPGFAQKSFFRTDLARTVSNHFALTATRRDVRLSIGLHSNVVRMHHYRKSCPPLMEKECADNYMKFRQRDTLLWKYKDRLVENVQNAIHAIALNSI